MIVDTITFIGFLRKAYWMLRRHEKLLGGSGMKTNKYLLEYTREPAWLAYIETFDWRGPRMIPEHERVPIPENVTPIMYTFAGEIVFGDLGREIERRNKEAAG
tara:strand:- start:459 stop:767 length:309 start_codon:yes stop_codon:yes gene_type:complete